MTEQPTPADELRTAASTLREFATDATPGPWRQHDTHLDQYGHTATVLSGSMHDGPSPRGHLRAWLPTMSQESWDETRNVWADAAYIALMHPGVGSALADWLDCEADRLANHLPAWGGARWAETLTPHTPAPVGYQKPDVVHALVEDHFGQALAVARAINGPTE